MDERYSENKPILNINENKIGIDYIIGDIHGEYDKLIRKLCDIEFNFSTDRLFAVGDIVDRGIASMSCYNLIKEDWFYTVRGNHENLIVETKKLGYTDRSLLYCNGAAWFADLDDPDWQYDIASDLDLLPYIIELDTPSGKIGIVHASPLGHNWNETIQGIKTNKIHWKGFSYREGVIWDRSFYDMCLHGKYRNKKIKGIDYVVTGHNHNPVPRISGNFYSIATIEYEGDFEFKVLNTKTMEIV